MSLSQRRCSHRSLHKGKKLKLLAVVLSGCKSNEELSWISHVKIINHSMGCKNNNNKKTIPMSWPYPLPIALKKHIFFSNLIEILTHFVLQLSCCYQNSEHTSIENNHDFVWVPEIYTKYTFSRGCLLEVEMKRFPNLYKFF